MFIKTWKKKGHIYASVYRSVRVGGKVKTETVAYLGAVEENQVPYLKAAYAKEKPALVYKDGTRYEG